MRSISPFSRTDAPSHSAGFTLCGKPNRRNCVVDGDTIHHDGVIIRIEGIDAPETHGFKCQSERALGMRATMRLLELVNAGPFEIVRKGNTDTDKYGRKLRDLRTQWPLVRRHPDRGGFGATMGRAAAQLVPLKNLCVAEKGRAQRTAPFVAF